MAELSFGQRNNPMLSIVGNTYSNEAINVFDLRTKDPFATTYWDDEWHAGEIITKSGFKLTGYVFKYDVVNHNIDLQYSDSVKVLPGKLLKEFTMFYPSGNRRFVDLNEQLKILDFQLGFFELMYEGTYPLVAKMETELLRANYVATHDAGNANDTFIKKLSYFMIKNGEVIRIPRKKKEALVFFDKIKAGTANYIKSNKLNHKKRSELLKIFSYLNG